MRRTTFIGLLLLVSLSMVAFLAGYKTVSAGRTPWSGVFAPFAGIVVNDLGDNTTAGDTKCTLREAINNANSNSDTSSGDCTAGSGADTITFSVSGTIHVQGQLTINSDMTLDGLGQTITVSGDSDNDGLGDKRVFISGGVTWNLKNLTVAKGHVPGNERGGGIHTTNTNLNVYRVTFYDNREDTANPCCNGGGAIYWFGATVNIDQSSFISNVARLGGAIYGGEGTLNITNSTFTQNTAESGGAIVISNSTTATASNSTFYGNSSSLQGGAITVGQGGSTFNLINVTLAHNTSGDQGGGIFNLNTLNVTNSIIASNTASIACSGSQDICNFGTFNNNGHNIVGSNPGLDPNGLQDNGGPTQTVALQGNSAALDAADDAVCAAAPVNGLDQRGITRPQGAHCDIGAYEDPHFAPTSSDNTRSTAEDTNYTFVLADFVFSDPNDTPPDTFINVKITGLATAGTLMFDSDGPGVNPAVAVNLNQFIPVGDITAGHLFFVPVADVNGAPYATFQFAVQDNGGSNDTSANYTFTINVTEVNDGPAANNDTIADIAEDSGTYSIPFATLLANDAQGPANESSQTLTIGLVSNPTGGSVQINGANVEFNPTANYSGPAGFDYTIEDNGTSNGTPDPKSSTGHVSFNITAVNDPPSFTIAGNPGAVNEDAGAQTVNGFATSISAGPGETGQVLTFNLTPTGTTGNLSFASAPAIDSTTGNLTYTTNADTNGTASFDVVLADNGSNTPPNSNVSAAQSFTITVNAVNDAPIVTLAGNPAAVNEDSGAQTVNSFASFQPGPVTATDEGTQTVVSYALTPTGTTGTLTFSSPPSIDTAGALTYTTSADTSGTATFNVVATDSGSGLAPNVNQSSAQSFTITVNAVNDPPSFTKGSDQSVQNNAGAQSLPNWATDIRKGPVTATDETGQTVSFNVSNDNNGIFTAQPAISPTGTLTFTPLINTQGMATVTVTLTDSGSNIAPNSNTSAAQTFTITVTSVDLTVSKTHVGNFKQTETGKTYTITVSNIGSSPSSGTVAITDNLPAGLKATGWGGTGWNNCTAMPVTGPATLTCDRSDALAANGGTYETLTLTVDVSCTAPGSLTNQATVSGGNDSTPGNNVSNDVTTINPDSSKPIITCPGGLSKYTDSGQVTAKITVNPAVATDNCGTVTVTGVRSDGKALNAPYPIGITIITWTAKDQANNTATCSQSVTVMVPSSPRRVPGTEDEAAALMITDLLMTVLTAVW